MCWGAYATAGSAKLRKLERTLVTDLQQQVTQLVDDLRTLSDTDETLHGQLTTEHQRAKTANRTPGHSRVTHRHQSRRQDLRTHQRR